MIGALIEIGGMSQIKLKSGEAKDRMNLVIADDSNHSVPITVWGDLCMIAQNKFRLGDVVAFKQCRVSDYNGKSLNASPNEKDIVLNVKNPRALVIAKWFSSKSIEQHQQGMTSLQTS